MDRAPVHILQTVAEHRAVDLVEEVVIDAYLVFRADAHQVLVIRGVVDLAQCESVGDVSDTVFGGVWDDVRGVEEFWMA